MFAGLKTELIQRMFHSKSLKLFGKVKNLCCHSDRNKTKISRRGTLHRGGARVCDCASVDSRNGSKDGEWEKEREEEGGHTRLKQKLRHSGEKVDATPMFVL